jgi:hypothetical protein
VRLWLSGVRVVRAAACFTYAPSMKIAIYASTIALGAVIALFGVGCTSAGAHYHTSRDEFARVASWPLETWRSSELIGATESAAFIRVWTADPRFFGGGEHVYSVPLRDLSTSEVAKIRTGENPWQK